jgi:hypothetical protein
MMYRTEIFTKRVSHLDHSFLKISAETDIVEWEIHSEGGGGGKGMALKLI